MQAGELELFARILRFSLRTTEASRAESRRGEGFHACTRHILVTGEVPLAKTHIDIAVAKRIVAGDETAFRALFDRVFPRLYRYAAARLGGDPDAIAEVVQQTFLKAIEGLDDYRGEAPIYAWFTRICHNAIVDHHRLRSREASHVLFVEDHAQVRAVLDALTAPATEGPLDQACARDVTRLVQAILDRLPPRYGDVLEWKYVEGLSVKEIAARLDTGPKAAESLLTRSRAAFREAVEALRRAGTLQAEELTDELGISS
jgi:RNA polymerase sigma-70 factor (ECF subfamily)